MSEVTRTQCDFCPEVQDEAPKTWMSITVCLPDLRPDKDDTDYIDFHLCLECQKRVKGGEIFNFARAKQKKLY